MWKLQPSLRPCLRSCASLLYAGIQILRMGIPSKLFVPVRVTSAAMLGNITGAKINISIWALKLRKTMLAPHGSAYFFPSRILRRVPLLLIPLPNRLSLPLTFSCLCVDHLRGRILWLSEFQLCVFKKFPFHFLEECRHFLCPWWHLRCS